MATLIEILCIDVQFLNNMYNISVKSCHFGFMDNFPNNITGFKSEPKYMYDRLGNYS